jgi:predicted tellurium resistance membrane protein TerC
MLSDAVLFKQSVWHDSAINFRDNGAGRMDWLLNPEIWIALVTLTVLEIVLGIDNIVFISILAGKLPPEKQPKARRAGLMAAMIMRILLLLCISWIIRLTNPLFTLLGTVFSGRDLVLLAGGLFLIAKATHEIHSKLEGEAEEMTIKALPSFAAVIAQIMVLDIVFSLDSVITAVGMTQYVPVMIVAIVIAVMVMLVAVEAVNAFISKHPTVSMLALSFLLLIGVSLIASGLHHEIPRGYIYFAMGFSVFVEILNLRMRQRAGLPVELRRQFLNDNP